MLKYAKIARSSSGASAHSNARKGVVKDCLSRESGITKESGAYSQRYSKCSRIELNMSETKHKQLQQAGGTFAMQLACAAGFLSDAKRINHKTGFI